MATDNGLLIQITYPGLEIAKQIVENPPSCAGYSFKDIIIEYKYARPGFIQIMRVDSLDKISLLPKNDNSGFSEVVLVLRYLVSGEGQSHPLAIVTAVRESLNTMYNLALDFSTCVAIELSDIDMPAFGD